MEINKTIHLLSNNLSSLEKYFLCKYDSVTSRSANAKEYLEKTFTELKNKQFFDGKCDEELRELHLLLLLNTELGIRNELESNPVVGHVVGAIPLLNSYIYLMLCHKFNLVRFLIEIIEIGPLGLATQVLISINSQVEYLPVSSYFIVLADMLNALFSRFLKSDSGYVSKNLIDYFQILLLYFKDEETFTQKNVENMKRSGYKWLSLIKLLNSITQSRFILKDDKKFIKLYDFSIIHDVEDETFIEINLIQKCYEKIFYKCQDFGKILDIDMFMTWHEIEYDRERTLQNAIGEEAFRACELLEPFEKLNKLPDGSLELMAIFHSVQKKPDTTEMNNKKLNKSRLQQKIFENVNFDHCFVNELKDFLENEVEQLDFEFIKILIYKLNSDIVKKQIDKEIIKHLILILLQKMEFEQILLFIVEYINKYGLHHILYEPSTDLTSLMERINCYEFDDLQEDFKILKDVTLLTFRSTYQVFKAFIRSGSSDSGNHDNILKILNILKPLCVYCTNSNFTSEELPLLVAVLQDFLLNNYFLLSVSERHQFSVLIFAFIQEDLINKKLFLHECLLFIFNIEEYISWQVVADLLRLLKKFLINYGTEIDFPMFNLLDKLAFILNSSTWDIASFSLEKLLVREEVISIIDLFMQLLYSTSDTEKFDKKFRCRLNKYSEFTKFYFHNFFEPVQQNTPEFQLISLIHRPIKNRSEFIQNFNDNEAVFILRMSEILPLCTLKELEFIIENYVNGEYEHYTFIFDFISDTISFISHCASQFCISLSINEANQIFSCLGNVINNFLIILQKNITSYRKMDNKINFIKYVNRFAVILQVFPSVLIDIYKFNLIKFVCEFVEKYEILDDLKLNSTTMTVENIDEDIRRLLVGLFLI